MMLPASVAVPLVCGGSSAFGTNLMHHPHASSVAGQPIET
jgi:hypothetical protein